MNTDPHDTKPALEIVIRGPKASGKTTAALRIGGHLAGPETCVTIHDDEGFHVSEIGPINPAGNLRHVVIRTQETDTDFRPACEGEAESEAPTRDPRTPDLFEALS